MGASDTHRPRPDVLYRIAVACGAGPLTAGLLILAGYAATEQRWLLAAGGVCLWVGVACFLLGTGCLLWRHMQLRSQGKADFPWAPALLLLANWPAALLCLAVGVKLATKYTVVVANHSDRPLQHVRLVGGGCDEPMPDIPPQGQRTAALWIQTDGELTLQFQRKGAGESLVVDGYVTAGMSGNRRVVIDSDGQPAVFDAQP